MLDRLSSRYASSWWSCLCLGLLSHDVLLDLPQHVPAQQLLQVQQQELGDHLVEPGAGECWPGYVSGQCIIAGVRQAQCGDQHGSTLHLVLSLHPAPMVWVPHLLL